MSSHHILPARSVAASRPAPLAALLAALAVGAGCSGDDRPFIEAAEVAQSGLTGLSISAPARTILPLRIAPGQSVELGLVGAGTGGTSALDGEDRDWTTSDARIVTVDRDGRLVGAMPGEATIGVDIAGIEARRLPVTVSAAPLAAVSGIDGSRTPDPCRASRYVAFGRFEGETPERLLAGTSWSLPEPSPDGASAPVLRPGDAAGEIDLVPRAPGPVTLRATAGGRALDAVLTVPSSLTRIAFAQPPILRADTSTNLTVSGTYTDTAGDTRTVDITDAVDFSIDASQASLARVSSVDGSRGRFDALEQGSVTVSASCGEYVAQPVTVSIGSGGTGTTGGEGLAFRLGARVTLSQFGDQNGRQVFVSTGGSYEEDDDVTAQVTFTSTDDTIARVVVNPNGVTGAFLVPGEVGGATVVAIREGRSAELSVTVGP